MGWHLQPRGTLNLRERSVEAPLQSSVPVVQPNELTRTALCVCILGEVLCALSSNNNRKGR